MNGDGFGVGALAVASTFTERSLFDHPTGWYDSVYDPELGGQPCIFTSVTPVSPCDTSLNSN